MTLYCDNISSIKIASNLIFHARTKYIEVHYHLVRERVELGKIQFFHIKTNLNLANIMTKVLGRQEFEQLCPKMGIISYLQLQEEDQDLSHLSSSTK